MMKKKNIIRIVVLILVLAVGLYMFFDFDNTPDYQYIGKAIATDNATNKDMQVAKKVCGIDETKTIQYHGYKLLKISKEDIKIENFLYCKYLYNSYLLKKTDGSISAEFIEDCKTSFTTGKTECKTGNISLKEGFK